MFISKLARSLFRLRLRLGGKPSSEPPRKERKKKRKRK